MVGGGSVAARKVAALQESGARVTVVSPKLIHELLEKAQAGLIEHIARDYQPGDLQKASLVIAATDDLRVNQAVAREACSLGKLVNVVDDPQHSNFIFPAVVRRGEMIIAITTGGASPAFAGHLRRQLERQIGPEYADLIALLGEIRPELIARYPDPHRRSQATLALLDAGLLELIRAKGLEAALQNARNWIAKEQATL